MVSAFQIIEKEMYYLKVYIVDKTDTIIETVSNVGLVKEKHNVFRSENIYVNTEMFL